MFTKVFTSNIQQGLFAHLVASLNAVRDLDAILTALHNFLFSWVGEPRWLHVNLEHVMAECSAWNGLLRWNTMKLVYLEYFFSYISAILYFWMTTKDIRIKRRLNPVKNETPTKKGANRLVRSDRHFKVMYVTNTVCLQRWRLLTNYKKLDKKLKKLWQHTSHDEPRGLTASRIKQVHTQALKLETTWTWRLKSARITHTESEIETEKEIHSTLDPTSKKNNVWESVSAVIDIWLVS